MTAEILTAAGVKFKKSRFPKPPAETYAVYFDDVEGDGADPVAPDTNAGLPAVYAHDVMIEVYEPKPDDKTESAIEAALSSRVSNWSKQDRVWLQDVQRYQVIYEFSYTAKN